MRKATSYISALIYIFLLTIISFNATAACTLNRNLHNSEPGLNNLDVNAVDYDVALVVDPVTKWSNQRTKSKVYSFNTNLNYWLTHNVKTFNLSNNPSAAPLQPSLWLMATSLLGGLVTRRVTNITHHNDGTN